MLFECSIQQPRVNDAGTGVAAVMPGVEDALDGKDLAGALAAVGVAVVDELAVTAVHHAAGEHWVERHREVAGREATGERFDFGDRGLRASIGRRAAFTVTVHQSIGYAIRGAGTRAA